MKLNILASPRGNVGRFLLSIVVCLRALSQCFIETLDFDVYIRLLEAIAKGIIYGITCPLTGYYTVNI